MSPTRSPLNVRPSSRSERYRPTSLVEVAFVVPEREALLMAAGYGRRVGTGAWWREVDAGIVAAEIA